jgi:hypothetical protein
VDWPAPGRNWPRPGVGPPVAVRGTSPPVTTGVPVVTGVAVGKAASSVALRQRSVAFVRGYSSSSSAAARGVNTAPRRRGRWGAHGCRSRLTGRV